MPVWNRLCCERQRDPFRNLPGAAAGRRSDADFRVALCRVRPSSTARPPVAEGIKSAQKLTIATITATSLWYLNYRKHFEQTVRSIISSSTPWRLNIKSFFKEINRNHGSLIPNGTLAHPRSRTSRLRSRRRTQHDGLHRGPVLLLQRRRVAHEGRPRALQGVGGVRRQRRLGPRLQQELPSEARRGVVGKQQRLPERLHAEECL